MSNDLPVVFLPGTQCDERMWMPLWRMMSVPDRRYVPLQWAETLEQMQSLTEHAVDGDKVHLVGFSMGGYIATLFALAHPQQIASLTLIGFSSAGLDPQEIQARRLIINALEKGQFRPMSEERLAQMVEPGGIDAGAARQVVRAMEEDLGGSVLKYHLKAASERPDLTQALAESGLVINILAAELDKVAPLKKLQAMHQQISGSRFHLFAGAGHMLPLEQPAALAACLSGLLCS
ncbi:alpha/beta fold hydrolase [Aliiglaciecola sp. CAU 1673]|uniref:alpha/beta fold hydrolase n=1 Tax=Aliiglaciecola sp. CAU 1673 TaxID=3032595 RepID=UPI0023DBC736|nr:alpha/beta fold hydrolase [Aliiglaciecola sp. CAU 1673]MDF2179108.1 alpha/beta fold hydrolase [Aliiglaciecola sp. CAU 1673]